MRQIRGKAALVTGAASGIGRAIALRLAEEGARLYLLDIDKTGVNAVAEEVQDLGVEVIARRCDLGASIEITASVQFILAQWGVVDILVNNAGVTYYGQTVNMSAEHWDRLLAVNLHAPIQLTRELLPTLIKQDEAHILNVASICGLVGLARVAAYTTTKFGLVGFGESLRHECGRLNVGVTTLCPGLVDTNLFAAAPHGYDVKEPKTPPRWMLTTADAVARRAIRAIYRNHHVVVMQPTSRLLFWIKRLAPWALDLAHHLRRSSQTPTAEQGCAARGDERRVA